MDKEIREKIGEILTEYLARTTEVNQFGLQEKLVGLFFSQRQSILDEVKEKIERLKKPPAQYLMVDGKEIINNPISNSDYNSALSDILLALSQEK